MPSGIKYRYLFFLVGQKISVLILSIIEAAKHQFGFVIFNVLIMREELMTAESIGYIHATVQAKSASLSDVFQQVMEVCGGIRYVVYIYDKITSNLSKHDWIHFASFMHTHRHTHI